MKSRLLLAGFVSVALSVLSPSCTKGIDNSRLTLYLTDAPASYDEVNVEILGIEIKTTDDFGGETWQVFPFANPGIYNLLELSNGVDTLLASAELVPGQLSQLRFILGDNNSIVVNGTSYELPLTASVQQSGLKLNINSNLRQGAEHKIWIDFDAGRSIVETGTGEYKLKPVLRHFIEGQSGAIKGVVRPLDAEATIYAISGTDTLSAIPHPVTGNFMIRGLTPGHWDLVAKANNGYHDKTINNINIEAGPAMNVDTLLLVR